MVVTGTAGGASSRCLSVSDLVSREEPRRYLSALEGVEMAGEYVEASKTAVAGSARWERSVL